MRGMVCRAPLTKTSKATKASKSSKSSKSSMTFFVLDVLDAFDVFDNFDVLKERLKCGTDGCITLRVFPDGCDLALVPDGSTEVLQGLVHALRI